MTDFLASRPESDHPIFFVGRRVRVRLSGECNNDGVSRALNDPTMVVRRRGHHPMQDGRTGKVFDTEVESSQPGHTFLVMYDEPYEEQLGETIAVHAGGCFAPHELIPLDADGNEVRHPALARFER